MNYIGKMWRPPSEANSLILQVTVGCSHNKCKFCNMYKEKDFEIKKLKAIKNDIDEAFKSYNNYRRVFLADGDSLIIPTEKLLKILQYLNNKFQYLHRITTYATPENINNKSLEELKKLRKNGLKMVYLGLESGSEKILKEMKKGANPAEVLKASKKLKKANIKNSTTIILGLGGQKDSTLHAEKTGELISKMEPEYLSALTLMVKENTPLYEEIKKDKFKLLNPREVLDELYDIIKNINVKQECIFRSNHASNYYSIKGTLPEDKKKMLKKLKYILNNPKKYHLKNEKMRRL
ncbi:MAG: radical SAM protein [Bacillota bacterium]